MFLLRVGEYVFLCVCTWSYLYILCTDVRGGFCGEKCYVYFKPLNVMYNFCGGRF
jgi:hypothetical protein